MNNEPVDLVGLLISIVALVASPEIAHLVGPYMAIFVLACAGAAFSASGTASTMRPLAVVWYVGIRVLLALAITVSLAELVQSFWPSMKPRITLVPLAFGIGCIRNFNAVRDWLAERLKGFVGRKLDSAEKGAGDGK
jgi:hypothetical protein